MEWTDDKHNHLISLIQKHGTKWKMIAQLMSKKFSEEFSTEQCRSRYRMNPTKAKSVEYKETIEIKADGTQISDKLVEMSEQEKKDPEYVLLAHGYDPNLWEIITVKVSLWHYRDKETPNGKISYATRLAVKPKKEGINLDDIKESIKDLMKNYKVPVYEYIRYSETGNMLEINMADLHLNKLGYKDGEYDHIQAEELFFFLLNDVLTQTEHLKFEKILFIWSHDFFNVDNLTRTTTAGTPQETTIRFANMYKQGKRMLIQGIDLLRQFAPVETVQVGANHDRLTSYTMSEVLEAWFRNDENVIIDNDPLHRKYRRYGNNLIGFSHGDKEKNRLGKIMPVEAKKAWGETLYAEIHAAHFHSEKAVVEENGVIVRNLSSPSGTDNWHYESGYVGAVRKIQSFVWDKERGLLNIIHSPIPINQSIEAVINV